MSDLFDQLKEGADQVISEVDKIRKTGQAAISTLQERLAEADRRRKAKQLQSDLTSLRGKINELMPALGIQTMGLYEKGKLTLPELVALCEHIGELKAQAAEKEKELAALQPSLPPALPAAPAPPTPAVSICPACTQPLLVDGAYCPYCGVKIAESLPSVPPKPRFCVHCGAALRAQSRFCPKCGAAVETPRR